MSENVLKRYIFASDFDQTLTFNDSGYVLAELVGIPTDDFERKAKGMAKINLVQQGAELAYLLLHDPEFKAKVRKEHLHEAGKRVRLKENIQLLYQLLEAGIDGHFFDFYVLSAAPVEVIYSALEGIVPKDHIYGTQFLYKPSGEIDTIVRATAGYGKVAVLDQLLSEQVVGPDHVISDQHHAFVLAVFAAGGIDRAAGLCRRRRGRGFRRHRSARRDRADRGHCQSGTGGACLARRRDRAGADQSA